LFFAGEVAVRWHREGGLGSALSSFFHGRRGPGSSGAGHALIPDEELGYRLNSARDEFNSLGVRHDELEIPKRSGRFRILVMGDSVAWDEPGFVSLIRDSLKEPSSRVEVINASVPGYTTYQERVFLSRLIGPVAPDLVVVQYCLNDNHRFLHQLTEDGGWLLTQEARRALLPPGTGLLARFLRWSYLALEIRGRLVSPGPEDRSRPPWESLPDFCAAWKDDTWIDTRTHLLAMRELAASTSARLLVIAVPFEPQLDPGLLSRDSEGTLKPQRMLRALCAEAGVPFVDLHPAFLARRGDTLYVDRVHLSPLGHEIAARELLERFAEERLLPP
jgi:lysophospholipase L1-like esterase